MNDPSLIPLKDALSSLKLSKTTLYDRLNKLDIHPIKIKGRAYLQTSDLSRIAGQVQPEPSPEQEKIIRELQWQLQQSTDQNEQLQQANESIRKENKQLTLLLGEERGRASAYQEHIKQLTDQSKANQRPWWQFWR